MVSTVRSAALITYTTWKALFLRAAVNSLSAGRVAWFWILAEPIAHIIIMMFVFTVLRVRTIGGISTAVWIMAGFLSFFMFRRIAAISMKAVHGSSKLFIYSQIRPADSVLVSAALEGFLMVIVTVILLSGAWMFGLPVIPDNPLSVIEALFGLWLLGLGVGLVNSVALELLPPLGLTIEFLLKPLYFLSGVIIPITVVPYPYIDWILLNPLVHGLEAARLGFAPYYHVSPEISVPYLYAWALCAIFLGLALHVHYAKRLATKR